jgi:hypothetical protein
VNAAELVATSQVIEAHAYDFEMLRCKCGHPCIGQSHAVHVALELRGAGE